MKASEVAEKMTYNVNSENTERIKEMIEDCLNVLSASNCPLNRWEVDFVESVSEQFEDSNFLTEAQVDKLESVWRKI